MRWPVSPCQPLLSITLQEVLLYPNSYLARLMGVRGVGNTTEHKPADYLSKTKNMMRQMWQMMEAMLAGVMVVLLWLLQLTQGL